MAVINPCAVGQCNASAFPKHLSGSSQWPQYFHLDKLYGDFFLSSLHCSGKRQPCPSTFTDLALRWSFWGLLCGEFPSRQLAGVPFVQGKVQECPGVQKCMQGTRRWHWSVLYHYLQGRNAEVIIDSLHLIPPIFKMAFSGNKGLDLGSGGLLFSYMLIISEQGDFSTSRMCVLVLAG